MQKKDGNTVIDNFDNILRLSGKRLSKEQLEAVNSKVATVVSAGAGSGKTTVLSFRFLKLVCDGIDADRILTITFTKKAAAEMYERIYKLLYQAANEVEDSYLDKQLKENFPKASISTMDSFWSEIARSGCMSYGITRNFSILSDEDSTDIVKRIVDRLASNDDIFDSYDYLSSNYKQSDIYIIFKHLARHIDILTEYSEDDMLTGLEDFIEIVKNKYANKKIIKGYIDQIESYRKYAKEGGIFDEGGDFDKLLAAFEREEYILMPEFGIKKASTTTNWNELKEIIKLYREYKKHMILLKTLEKNRNGFHLLAKVFSVFVNDFNKEKRKRGLLSFTDVQALAKSILINDRNIRNFYKNKFDFIMVDEFQDNNNEQKDLLYLLSEKKDIFSNSIPDATEIDSRKLFFVGDDKQSIYRFRGADVSVFNNLKKEVVEKMGGVSLSLGTNYRSEKKLVEHFNLIFSEVFCKQEESNDLDERIVNEFTSVENGIFEASASDINPGRTEALIEPVIEFATFSPENSDDNSLSAEESEAEYIADRIIGNPEKNIVGILSDPKFQIPDNGKLREPKLDDIGILYSKTKAQMPIERALRRRGIQYTVVESSSATLDGIAYDLYSFLQLLVYPTDRLSYIELLSSPFARISNDGLRFFLDKNKEGLIAFDTIPEFDDNDDLDAFLSLKELYDLSIKEVGRESLTATLDRLYYQSGYRTYLMSTENLSVYDEHFSYLWTLAYQEDASGGNIVSFLDRLRPMIGKAEKLDGIEIQRLESNGVKLMTIHKSKGLEFPIVILAGSGSVERDMESRNFVVDSSHNGKPFVAVDAISGESADNSKDCISKPIASFFNKYNQKRIKAERKRVLYVALTRAINHILITAVPHSMENKNGEKAKSESLYRLYWEALDKVDRSGIEETTFQSYSEEDKRQFRSGKSKRDMSWYSNSTLAREPVWNDIKAGVKESSKEEYDSDMAYQGDVLPDFNIEPILSSDNALRADFGTLVHCALEKKITGEGDIDYYNRNLKDDEIRALIDSAENIAEGFINSRFYSDYLNAFNEFHAEVGFFYPNENKVLEGSVDLLAIGDTYNLIVDYKTDKHKNPDMHKWQLTLYINAMTEIYKKPCYGVLCYVRDFSSGPVWDKSGNIVDF